MSDIAPPQPQPEKKESGLFEPEAIPVPARGGRRHYPLGKVVGDFFYLGDKPFGVEPGFVAVKIDKALLIRLLDEGVLGYDTPEQKAAIKKGFERMSKNQMVSFLNRRMDELHLLVNDELLHQPEQQKDILDPSGNNKLLDFEEVKSQIPQEVYNKRKERLDNLGKVIKALNQEGRDPNSPLELWLIKQDYQDGLACPPEDRLLNTNAMKNAKKWMQEGYIRWKRAHANEDSENINALLETLANEVAGLMMTAQEQKLLIKDGAKPDDNVRLVTACKWEKKLEMFTGCLAGSAGHEKYYVKVEPGTDGKPVPVKDENGFYTTDDSVNLGEQAALMMLLGDNDTIGSQGQNKGRVGNEVFGLDFGHAFRDAVNPLVANMRTDLNFNQNKKTKKFKHMGTIFQDSELSERMQGMFYLYRLMGEEERKAAFGDQRDDIERKIEAAISKYKATNRKFAEKIDKLKEGGLQTVFEKYIDEMKKGYDEAIAKGKPKQAAAFKKYMEEAQAAQKSANKSLVIMMKTMKERMQLSPQEVDLLQNLERLCSKTTRTSKDGTCLLKHLKVVDPEKNRVEWNMTRDGHNNAVLTAKVTPKEKAKLIQMLKEYEKEFKHEIEGLEISAEGELTIKCKYSIDNIAKLCELFKEENIKQFKAEKAPELDATPPHLKEKIKAADAARAAAAPTHPSPPKADTVATTATLQRSESIQRPTRPAPPRPTDQKRWKPPLPAGERPSKASTVHSATEPLPPKTKNQDSRPQRSSSSLLSSWQRAGSQSPGAPISTKTPPPPRRPPPPPPTPSPKAF